MTKEVPESLPIVAAGVAAGWPLVRGVCPACGSRSLFLASGGYVTCAIIRCPNPTAVADGLLPATAVVVGVESAEETP